MKILQLLSLIAALSLMSCKDQINTIQNVPAGERIVFTTLDLSIHNGTYHAISADSNGMNQKDLGIGFIFDVGLKKIFWATGDSTMQTPTFYVSDKMGNNATVLNLQNPHERFEDIYGYTISPDGSKVLYGMFDTVLRTYNLYMINADGSNKHLFSNTYDHQTYLCFSPDGNQIAYYRDFDDAHNLKKTIEIANVDGSSRFSLTAITDAMVDGYGSIAWSRKNIIAYVDDDTVFTIHSDGTGKIPVAFGYSPSWSPTGDTLAFADDDIKITSDNGLTLINVTNSDGIAEGWPHWSADGKRLLITRWIGDFDNTLLTLEELALSSMTTKIIASPGAFGYFVN